MSDSQEHHNTDTHPDGNGHWVAVCRTCGWIGRECNSEELAEIDGCDHASAVSR